MAPYVPLPDGGHTVSKPSAADLEQLARDETLRGLTIFDYALPSLEPLAALRELEVLKIVSPTRITTLSGLAPLSNLHTLLLSTPPTWDGSGRCIEVESYRPLVELTRLEHLSLGGIRPRDLDLAPIASMRHLKQLHIGGVAEFVVDHFARLAAALPGTEGRCLQPYTEIKGVGLCKRCGGRSVLLTGAPKRTRHWLCPTCNAKKLAEHVRRWETIKAAAG